MLELTHHDNPAVSIIVPCFNDGQYLLDAFASIERVEVNLWELVVVNDGSTDLATLDALKAIEDQGHRVVHQENRGLGAARNAGVRASSGKYLLPLDADNRIRPEYLKIAIAALDEDEGIGVVHSDASYFGSKTGTWETRPFVLRDMLLGNYIDACAVIRRKVWEDCRGYDENMPYQGYEDWDFWLRAASLGWRFFHVPQPLFEYRVREGSMIARLNADGRAEVTTAYVARKHAEILKREYDKLFIEHRDQARELQFRRAHAIDLKQRPVRTLVRLALGKMSSKKA